ncbi:MAG: ubiquinol-cytochrome c reductase iron-sulfur subunit [Deltaproteobacteria bacterium]|nr:ubiquinol-cytochrome c reductase iron-sulfur subunit [Deltaproteobacteria bacterium]
MALIDDLKDPPPPEELDRRRMLTLLGTGALGVATAGATVETLHFLEPAVVYEPERRVAVGRPGDLSVGAVKVVASHRLYVVREPAGVFALSAVCTHLGCITRCRPDRTGFDCPCHGSRFALDGSVQAGPAPRPLRRLHVEVDQDTLVVDAARVIAPGSLLRVPA